MTISETPGVIKKFKRSSWGYQMTFVTPSKNLGAFVRAILSANEPLKEATVTIDQYVFEPKNLLALKSARTALGKIQHDASIMVEGPDHIDELLRASLLDWLDFLFVPTLKLFVIYADHDEYTTFYANTKSNLERIRLSLLNKKFEEVVGWKRQF